MNTSTDPNDYSGTFVDWGTNIGSGQSWYTLSNTEWTYLLGNNGRRVGGATITVDGVAIRGVVLLPDVFNGPAFTSGGTSFTQNNYTPESWAAMEEAGAVFLPLAGYREGSNVTNDQDLAYYWTNTPATYRKMGRQGGSWSWTRTGTDGTYKGFAVRLVHNAN